MMRAIVLSEAACIATANGRPALFIPVVLPDAIINDKGEVIQLRHRKGMDDARS